MKSVYNKVLSFKKRYSGTIAFRLKKHAKVIDYHINPDEQILYAFCGQKNFDSKEIFSTCIIALTNKRILIAQKRLLWGYFYTTITPDMYNDLKIHSGLIWGKVLIDTVKELICISNIDKKALDEIETAISSYMMEEKKNYNLNRTEESKK